MARKSSNDFIDITALLKQYLSKWYLFVISVLVCGGLAFFVTKVKKPVYAVNANILISTDNSSSQLPNAMSGGLSSLFGSDAYVEDEIFLVSSHSLYRDVARDLGLNQRHYVRRGFMNTEFAYPHYPVEIQTPAGMLDTLGVGMEFRVKVDKKGEADIKVKALKETVANVKDVKLPYIVKLPWGDFTVAATKYFVAGENLDTRITLTGYDAAAEVLDDEVGAEIASKRSNVITLSMETAAPVYGKDVLNEILVKYNQRGIMEKRHESERTGKFIEDRLVLLSDELAQSDNDIEALKHQKGIIDPTTEIRYQTEKKAEVEAKMIEARTQLEVYKLMSDFINDPANEYDLVPLMMDSQNFAEMFSEYNHTIISRQQLLNSAHPDNVNVKLLDQRLDALRSNINTSLNRLTKSQTAVVRDLQRELDGTAGQLSNMTTSEREFKDLFRQNQVKSSLYLFLLQRREENQLMEANTQPKAQIIDEAYTMSEPLGMGKKMILILGILFGLVIPPMFLYVRRLIYNRFETRQDVERITEVPILGEMCTDTTGRSVVVSPSDTSPATELFRLMRVNLLFVLNDASDKVVLVTSSSSGEGKSFISINLAASLVLMGKKVIVVGMDLRNPRLAEYLHMTPARGLSQYLSSSDVSLQQIINPAPGVKGMDVICAGPVPPNPGELLISNKVDNMFAELRAMYDYIIVDTAPIGLVSDTFTLDRVADAAIYVCRANYTSVRDLDAVNDIFEQKRLKKLSLVINGTAAKKSYGYAHKKTSEE